MKRSNKIICGGQPLTWPFSLDLNVMHYIQFKTRLGGKNTRTTTRSVPISEVQGADLPHQRNTVYATRSLSVYVNVSELVV